MTRKYFLLFNLLFVSLSFFAQEGPGKVRFVKQNSIFQIRVDTQHHLAFPDVVKLSNDSLLVTYRQGEEHIDTFSTLISQVGSPNGTLWMKPDTIFNDPLMDDRDPSTEVLSDGSLVINFFKRQHNDPLEAPPISHLFIAHINEQHNAINRVKQIDKGEFLPKNPRLSKDNFWIKGLWGRKIETHASASSLIEYKNKLLLPSYGGYPLVRKKGFDGFLSPKSTIAIYQSRNQGKSWKKNDIEIPNTSSLWLQEPALVNIGDSLLILHVRTAGGNSAFGASTMIQTTSKDDGKTWSNPTEFDFIGQSPELYQLSNGVLIDGFRLVDKNNKVAFIFSDDNGASWSEPQVIDYCRGECGYPAMVEIDKNHVLFVYYNENAHQVKGVIYTVVHDK